MTLYASGTEVGLSFGEIGNSEVGHLNIGAGRVYYQSMPRINQSIADGSFFDVAAFKEALGKVKEKDSALHLISMLGSGNVHAANEHLFALLELCLRAKVTKNVFVHVILDGRDCSYNAGAGFVKELLEKMKSLGVGAIATVSGRFYAMDRDNRWERIAAAYQAMGLGRSEKLSDDPVKAIEESYANKVYDEEFVPTVITKSGKPVAIFSENDAAIFCNFRPDRARELTKAFVLPGFDKFERPYIPTLLFVTMMEYERDLPVRVAFQPQVVRQTLAETVSLAGLKQLHIAETEKYAHVTFFLNGTIEEAFPGEERMLVPSPHVANYVEVPAMSAPEITKELLKAATKTPYDLIVVNFANADMVGHTGNLPATVAACEIIDKCLGQIVDFVSSQGGVTVLTADHGNAEEVLNLQTGNMDKEHSTNPVPLLIIGKDFHGLAGPSGDAPEGDLSLLSPVGVLADVAPIVLKLMGITQPPEMTGRALI